MRSIYPKINYKTATVELRRENCKNDKLLQVRLRPKSGQLAGTGTTYPFKMAKSEVVNSSFTFFLWTIDDYSRNKQAGVCEFTFQDSASKMKEISDGYGIIVYGDFYETRETFSQDCASIQLTLKYKCRSGSINIQYKFMTIIPVLSYVICLNLLFIKGSTCL